MGKHAYLIIAHNNEYILNKSLSLIDDERNDIYLHVDKKTNLDLYMSKLQLPTKSNFYLLSNRIDTKWGHISFVETELALFESAHATEKYSYYHLISGVDLPIKNQDYIHNFFDVNQGIEFIGFDPNITNYDQTDRVYKIHIATRHFKDPYLKRKIWFFLDNTFVLFQKIIHYSAFNKTEDYVIKKGCNWVSLTNECVEYVLSQKKKILSRYKYAVCPDEIFLHTTIYNSYLRNKINPQIDEYEGCMRLIDWHRGNPYVFTKDDFQIIVNSDRLFARKFDQKDLEIVDLIHNYIKN